MAESTSQDLLLLLKSIETAKGILEPSKIEELELSYKLESAHDLKKENLRLAREDRTALTTRRDKLYDSLSSIEKTKFKDYISPDTGNLSKHVGKKLSTLNDAISRYDNDIVNLTGEIDRIEEVAAQRDIGSLGLKQEYLEDAKWAAGGALKLVFEKADFDLALEDYLSKLPTDITKEQVMMRQHGFTNAYSTYTIDKDVSEKYREEIQKFDVVYQQDFKSRLDPLYQQTGATPGMIPNPNAPLIAEQAYEKMKKDISTLANEKYILGEWDEKNAPIKIDSTGKAVFDESKFNQYIENTFQSVQGFQDMYSLALNNFTSHSTTLTAFERALANKNNTGMLLNEIAPGLSIGGIALGQSFTEMQRFFEHPSVQDFLNTKTIKKTTFQNFLKGI